MLSYFLVLQLVLLFAAISNKTHISRQYFIFQFRIKRRIHGNLSLVL
jgi:hypothetical protein